jgi:hypothetical protein
VQGSNFLGEKIAVPTWKYSIPLPTMPESANTPDQHLPVSF